MLYSYLMHRTWMRRACLTLQILCIGILPISISFLILLVLCHLYSHIAAYVFLPILAEELKEFKKRWNCHRIRWNRLSTCPCYVPNDVYHLVGHIGNS